MITALSQFIKNNLLLLENVLVIKAQKHLGRNMPNKLLGLTVANIYTSLIFKGKTLAYFLGSTFLDKG
jgi:hypothetical protein